MAATIVGIDKIINYIKDSEDFNKLILTCKKETIYNKSSNSFESKEDLIEDFNDRMLDFIEEKF